MFKRTSDFKKLNVLGANSALEEKDGALNYPQNC